MANRSGGGSTAAIGRLQEARESLMKHLGCRVDCVVADNGLSLRAHPPPPKKGRFGKVVVAVEVPADWGGFPVVVAEPPSAP